MKRVDFLTTERFDEEVVVYHHLTHAALFLDKTATRVFDMCDGQHSFEQMVAELGDEASVQQALETLAEHGLLQAPELLPRRSFLGKAAMVAGVLAAMAPEPSWAASLPTCVNASGCNDLVTGLPSVAGNACAGCDPFNPAGGPATAQCNLNNCLTWYVVTMNAAGSVVVSTNCAGDNKRSPGVNTCEQTQPSAGNPTPFWSRDCNTSRGKVIAQWVAGGSVPGAISNYKCCPQCCTVTCP